MMSLKKRKALKGKKNFLLSLRIPRKNLPSLKKRKEKKQKKIILKKKSQTALNQNSLSLNQS